MAATPTVPEMFRVITLDRYFMWCRFQRDHYKEIKVTWETDFFDSMEMQHAFMCLSYWYAGLYVVCEGWQELKLSDSEIDKLLASPYLDVLRRYRNGVFHFQQDYFDKRLKEAIKLGQDFHCWVEELMSNFQRYFRHWWQKHQLVILQMKAKSTAVN